MVGQPSHGHPVLVSATWCVRPSLSPVGWRVTTAVHATVRFTGRCLLGIMVTLVDGQWYASRLMVNDHNRNDSCFMSDSWSLLLIDCNSCHNDITSAISNDSTNHYGQWLLPLLITRQPTSSVGGSVLNIQAGDNHQALPVPPVRLLDEIRRITKQNCRANHGCITVYR